MAGNESVRLTNADFRSFVSSTPSRSATTKGSTARTQKKTSNFGTNNTPRVSGKIRNADKSKSTDDNEISLVNIMQKYRDRAKERRTTSNGAVYNTSVTDTPAADLAATASAAINMNKFPGPYNMGLEKRRLVEESKYLGGDMEHTHLVRGLDYALLQKVRAEVDQQEKPYTDNDDRNDKHASTGETSSTDTFSTRMARNIYDLHFNLNYPERNELFMPGRMRFEYDLQDSAFAGTPTVIIRSKVELKTDVTRTVSTTDLVIDKLTEIFAYHRRGLRLPKQAKRPRSSADQWTTQIAKPAVSCRPVNPHDADARDADIFDDVDDEYDPTAKRTFSNRHGQAQPAIVDGKEPVISASHTGVRKGFDSFDQRRGGSYFQNAADAHKSNGNNKSNLDTEDAERKSRRDEMSLELARLRSGDVEESNNRERKPKLKSIVEQTEDSYAECYPGYDISSNAANDSDEDDGAGVDNASKTDGSKKSQLSRWDFESQEDYSRYMGQLEATPRAAFQFGQKMNDGRRTRKAAGKSDSSNDKVKFDQQWTKIQKIIDTKRNERP